MNESVDNILTLFQHSPTPIFATDENNYVLSWNSAVECLLGFHTKDAIGRHCDTLLAGTDLYGNTFCDRECNVQKLIRRKTLVRWFDIGLRHCSGDVVWARCAPLVLYGSSPSGFTIIHSLEKFRKAELRVHASHPKSVFSDLSPKARHAGALSNLTAQEHRVLSLMSSSLGTTEIAESLSVSTMTVRSHIRSIFRKLGVHSRVEAVVIAMQDWLSSRTS